MQSRMPPSLRGTPMTVIQRDRHLPGVCLVSWLKRGPTIVELRRISYAGEVGPL
jgi:hypothetical protein